MFQKLIVFISCMVKIIHAQSIVYPYEKVLNGSTEEGFHFNRYTCGLRLFREEQCKDTCSFIIGQCCDCREDCMKRQSCCIDKYWNETKSTNQNLKQLTETAKQYQQLSCEHLPAINQNIQPVLMVSTCTILSNKNDSNGCLTSQIKDTDLASSLPVYGKDGNMYRNKFCARCNQMYNYTTVEFNVKCVDASIIKENNVLTISLLNGLKNCSLSYPNSTHIRKCIPTDQCKKGNKYYDLCHSYEGGMSNAFGSYRNYHCYKCSAASDKTLKNLFSSRKCGGIQADSCVDLQNPCYVVSENEESTILTTFDMKSVERNVVIATNVVHKFPTRNFFQITDSFKFPFNEGLEQYLCNSKRSSCCSCAKNCMERQTCCIDKLWNNTNSNLETYLKLFIESSKTHRVLSCYDVFPSAKSIGHTSDTKLMVKTCKSAATDVEFDKCINPPTKENIPVVGSDKYIYSNMHCARCNFIKDFRFTDITAECESTWPHNESAFREIYKDPSKPIDLKRNFRRCKFSFKNNQFAQDCDDEAELNVTCNRHNKFYNLCHAYKAPFGNFKNYHCWKCHTTESITTNLKNIEYCDPCPQCNHVVQPETPRHFRWSLLINFAGDFELTDGWFGSVDIKASCRNGTVFNSQLSKCTEFVCPPNYHPYGTKCVLKNSFPTLMQINVSEPNYDNCLLAHESSRLYIIQHINNTINIENFTRQWKIILSTNETFQQYYQYNSSNILVMNEQLTIDLFRKLSEALLNTVNTLSNYIDSVVISSQGSILSELYQFDVSRAFHGGTICAQSRILDRNRYTFNASCFAKTKGFPNNSTISPSEFNLWMMFGQRNISRHMSVCDKFHMHSSCPLEVITGNISKKNNNTLKDFKSKKTYSVEEYTPLQNGSGICIMTKQKSLKQQSKWIEKLYDIEYYVSIIGTSLSIFCYVWIILIFIVLKELQTIPGLSTTALCLSLLLADCLFLIATQENQNENICKSVSILMHWFILIAFMWSLIIAVDLASKFKSFTAAISNKDKYRSILKRCVVSTVLPFIIVGITVLLDEFSSINVGYGIYGVCWITNLNARIGSFIVPVVFMFMVTASALLYTLCKIYRVNKKNGRVLKKEKKNTNTIKIALKLICILGISECIGFIQITNPNDDEVQVNAIFGFLYSLVRSTRGLMLWFVYIYSGHIVRKYKKLYKDSVKNQSDFSSRMQTKDSDLNKSYASHTSDTKL